MYVATVLTVYGIETLHTSNYYCFIYFSCNSTYRLRYWNPEHAESYRVFRIKPLQQYLPFTVLKLNRIRIRTRWSLHSCNSTYRLRYWNHWILCRILGLLLSCNSTYRLRYWNDLTLLKNVLKHMYVSCNSTYCLRYATKGARQQRREETMRTAHL